MVSTRLAPCQCRCRALASGDAHILHAVRGVHNHTTGRGLPVGLPVDGRYVSGFLTDFQVYIHGGRTAWVSFQELLCVSPPANQIQKFVVNCTWFQETFGECPAGADEETVKRFARAYIMMLLGTQLFADKSGNCIHIRWLPYVARIEEMDGYSWGLAALAWLYRCMCRVANRHVVKLAGPL
ncbi:protein MAIN-LIKE 2-like [Arachis duranensis]|uniref:Protein MAIN-LIKE 2-like n=1 Tax=Arachis duranensis TaxID=130453 RepID=A0A6P4AY02_ARADU|nr:protein MAIN-LIKE 2-like [Arachis duranensis]